MKGDDEIEMELVRKDAEWMRKRTWFHWQKGTTEWVVHDLIFPNPPGVTSRPLEESDMVLAYPELYVRDMRMRELSLKLIRYADLRSGYLMFPGRTSKEEPEPEKPVVREDVRSWFKSWMPYEFTMERARNEAVKNGYNPEEIRAILDAMMKKGTVYEFGKDVFRKV